MGNPRTITSLDEPISHVMATVSIEIGPVATIREIIDVLAENDIGSVPVVDRETRRLIGVVGERDVVRSFADGVDVDSERVSDVMTFTALTVTPTTTIRRATELMEEGGIRHLPVVDNDSKLVGMLSMRDLLSAHVTVAP